MKKLVLYAALIVLTLSCNEGTLNQVYRSFATSTEINSSKLFLLDNQQTVYIDNLSLNTPVGSRILMDYEIIARNSGNAPMNVFAHNLLWVTTKDIVALTAENSSEIGNDKFVSIGDADISGGYINILFNIPNAGIKHTVNLVQKETIEIDEDGKVDLEFKQNANGSNGGIIITSVASFNMNMYIAEAQLKGLKKIEFTISVELLGWLNPYTFTLKYNVEEKDSKKQISYSDTSINTDAVN